ncbi:MAG: hypothetical protein PUP46_05980 [Endozoicomonas sp. (ex Botrylloides leachii)]|nr:hypothetical protein [Endozoicomonas sp. (ex Botrylloides leachii)]
MKLIIRLICSPVRTMRVVKKNNRRRIKQDLLKIKKVFAQEREETHQMLTTYRRFTLGLATKDEMKKANKQMVDLFKGLGIGFFALLPLAPLTIPIIIMLGRRFDINVLPSAFYDEKDRSTNAPKER